MKNYPAYMMLNKVLQWLWLILGGQGIVLWTMGCLGVAMNLEDYDVSTLVVGLVLLGLALWMFRRGLARKQLAKTYRMATAMLSENSDCTVEEMASVMGMKPAKLRIDLRRLVKHRLLPGYILNEGTGELMLMAHAAPAGTMAIASVPMIPLRCPSCGGTTMVEEGSNARCEYCGNPLDY